MLTLRRGAQAGATAAAALYARAVARSRRPELYATMGAPDTAEGRFELLTAHILLIIERLDRDGEAGRALSQTLFDLYLRNLDGALREMGVGDLAVGKRMKGLGKIFYGRATAYAAAFQSSDRSQLEALIARTILAGRPEADAAAIANHLILERDGLSRLGLDDVTRGGAE